jgi:uncharacterized protein YecE (DUF72 family)
VPAPRVVDGWRAKTPPGFLFAAKIPQVITHERLLEGCRDDLLEFLRVMERLEDKLGPLLLQFRYFRKAEFPDPGPFLDRLERFLPLLPRGRRLAVELRNKTFLTARLVDLLRRHGAALAFIDHPWFPPVGQLLKRPELLTADFAYVRWLGDRRAIEERTQSWDRLIVDRSREMGAWVEALRAGLARGRETFGYFNNHYAGYAIGSIEAFRGMWEHADDGTSPG